ncbi:hypothetical protein [Streptomyces sp. NPDC001787]|uniref:hypothetical protein n=1 Tax=Streptomyces sp. NPDC001787 TaxID=3154523 RepID=UPI003332D8F1
MNDAAFYGAVGIEPADDDYLRALGALEAVVGNDGTFLGVTHAFTDTRDTLILPRVLVLLRHEALRVE